MDTPVRQQRRASGRTAASTGSPSGDPRPVVVLSANSSWNLLNFRTALLDGLQDAGYRLVAFVPEDQRAGELRRRGIEVWPIPFERAAMNPASNVGLLLRYVRALRRLRPAAYCGFTIKPNVYGALAARLARVPVINNVTGLGTVFLSKGLLWALGRNLYRFAFRRSRRIFFHNADDHGYLPDDILCKVDRAAMAVSLETRVPFLDHRVAAVAARIPLTMKVGERRGKMIVRRLLDRYVPRKLVERPKAGFAVPVGQWIKGPLKDWAESLLDEGSMRRDGWLDADAVRRRWQDHLAGRSDGAAAIWSILMFQAWLHEQDVVKSVAA